MATIAEIRAKYPQYKDMSDKDLADAMHQKFYADMPREEFNAAVGFNATPEGEVGLVTPADDTMRVIADSMTRGYYDKYRGAEEQAHTQRSRERLPGVVEATADVTGAALGMPYRVASTAWGGVAGGLEGMANAYGHQEGWVPEWGNIGMAGIKGAVLGSGAAKLGEWVGKGLDKVIPDYAPSAPPPVQATQAPRLGPVGTAIHGASKVPLTTTVPIDWVLSHIGVPPVVSGTTKGARLLRPLFKPRLPADARPPEPASAQVMRDLFAKTMIGYGRTP